MQTLWNDLIAVYFTLTSTLLMHLMHVAALSMNIFHLKKKKESSLFLSVMVSIVICENE